jgi:BirA family biotin operon repressor/biotin-[acetyl-CoA-carboxylase] ligase
MRRVHFDVTDSTNTQARRLAGEFPGERILVTADEQRAGRGRLGRAWHSPRGGAWLSLAWPMHNAPGTYAAASLVAAVATLRAVREAAPWCADRLQVKWPNDLLLDGRKVAGILCEQFFGVGAASVLVVGVGLNVDVDVAELGSELRHPAATLRTVSDPAVTVEAVVDVLAKHLTDALVGFETEGLSEPMLAELRAHLAYAGSVQTFQLAGRVVTGRVTGVDASGRLVLACEGGEVAFDSGEFLVGGAPSRQL